MEQLVLTRDQVRRIDTLAIEQYNMPGVILMENAGRNAAKIIIGQLKKLAGRKVSILCGPGNNGGDGYVIARHLYNAGFSVRIGLAADPRKIKGDAAVNYEIVRNMPIAVQPVPPADSVVNDADLIVDALLGTGFSGLIRPPMDRIIKAINDAGKFVVAVDVPSGLDCSSGQAAVATVRADLTVTFVAVKAGMLADQARQYTGQIQQVDIGVPRDLIDQVSQS